jgi:hypothetical protein
MNTISSPPDIKNGVITGGGQFQSTVGNVWAATFGPYNQRRYISRMMFVPPTGMPPTGDLFIWAQTTKIGIAPGGTSRQWTPVRMVPVHAGLNIFVVWYYAGGTAPEVTLFSEQDEWT